MPLPTARELNPTPEDLDEKWATKHFLGKTLEQAEALFRENSCYYCPALMWMGPVGFRYYVQAYISYLQSKASTGDKYCIDYYEMVLNRWLDYSSDEIKPIASELAASCVFIGMHHKRFHPNPWEGQELRLKFKVLRRRLNELVHSR